MKNFSAFMGVCLFLAGCASSVDCKVVAFHALEKPQGERVLVSHDDTKEMKTAEFLKYASLVGEKAQQVGYLLADRGPKDLIFKIDYGVGRGADEVANLPECTAQYHYRDGEFDQSFRREKECDEQEAVVHATYIHFLELRVVRTDTDLGDQAPAVYEGVVHSISRNSVLSDIMPYLVAALFEDFPGESGQVRRVAIEEAERK